VKDPHLRSQIEPEAQWPFRVQVIDDGVGNLFRVGMRFWLFSKMSTNYSADLTTRVEPCPFGSTPDCNQCGCVISSGLHRVQKSAGSGTAKSRTPGPRFDGHWFTAQSAALKVGRSITLEPPSRASAEPGLVQVGLNEGTIDVSEQPSP
jgi:hypothetical protein